MSLCENLIEGKKKSMPLVLTVVIARIEPTSQLEDGYRKLSVFEGAEETK
jgi:hypothetical protein